MNPGDRHPASRTRSNVRAGESDSAGPPRLEGARAPRGARAWAIRGVAGGAALTLLLLAAPGRADESRAARRAAAAREQDRPYTMVEVSGGVMALPGADVCPISVAPRDCEQGETSISVGIHNIYRWRYIGFGAGIFWAASLSTDAARGAPELERDHERSYFMVEGLFRYYFLRSRSWEWWAGATLGGVVVNDSWSVEADRNPYSDTAYVGPRAATIGTEGVAAGLAIGGEWTFAPNWSLGSHLRYSSWFLPSERKVSPTGDRASLSDRVDMFNIGLRIAYYVAL
ncbi:hypothetical protein SOCEGT47_018340 [Sorangium cellulosum]|uniref:Outer membrane protein beta-barrel domain-containing protein n=1 Tax=Sorangium cellulosum TaxID=56 RepID=A0A4V0ND41_SORCE|nr:hypothetical protein [Sorangium cellulosum]AUX21352.1 hypothetical protein SOCEGT47_018340 [Sorangium cellulosum]